MSLIRLDVTVEEAINAPHRALNRVKRAVKGAVVTLTNEVGGGEPQLYDVDGDELDGPLTTDRAGRLIDKPTGLVPYVESADVDLLNVHAIQGSQQWTLQVPVGGGVSERRVIEHLTAADIYLTSPASITLDEDTFTAHEEKVTLDVTVSAAIEEGAGCKAVIVFYYGDPADGALNTQQQNIPNPDATAVQIGGMSGIGDSIHHRFEIEDLTVGEDVKWEIAGGIVGFANAITLPETPVFLSSSRTGLAGGDVGDFFIAARGATKTMLLRSNHAVGDVVDELVAYWDTPAVVNGNHVKMAPNSSKIVCPNFTENTIKVIDVATLEVQGTYAIPGGFTNPQHVAISPDSTMAYITCVGTSPGKILPMTIATGAFGAGWNAGVGPCGLAVSTDGASLFVPRYYDQKLSIFDLPAGTLRAQPAYVGGAVNVTPVPSTSVPLGNTVAMLTLANGGTDVVAIHNDDTLAVAKHVGDFFGPSAGKLLSDGRTILIGSTRDDLGHQILHLNVPGGIEFTRWANVLSGVNRKVNDLAITPNGSIFMTRGPNEIVVYFGGVFHMRPSLSAFAAEFISVVVEGGE